MVVFTCQHCGDSVNKPKVAKHYFTKCRNKHPSLTCVDCLKDFIGDEYDVHTQCMTEAERYSAKGTVFKENTGRNKQAKYVEMIQNLLNTHRDLSDSQRKLLTLCSEFDNVPRKHGKFLNFMKNIARKTKHTKEDLDSVFNIIEEGWLKEVQAKSSVVQTAKESSLIKEGAKANEESGVELEEADVSLKTNDSKKKKKKKYSESSQLHNSSGEAQANGVNDKSGTDLESSVETQKTKKKKHSTSQCQEDDEKCVENNKHDAVLKGKKHSSNTDEKNDSSSNANIEEEMSLENSNSGREANKTVKEMSKKFLKKQKKYEKYLQELENERESKSKDEDREMSEDDSFYNSKKKLKQSKKHETLKSEEPHHEDNSNNVESSCHMEVELQGDSEKKNKKRKHNDSQSEINGKKVKSEIALEGEEEDKSHASFDWADVIIRVLESRPDKELSLKKLGKKVINEYQTVKADHRTYEELLVRFNKKVMKTKRVRVLKEKAKIIE